MIEIGKRQSLMIVKKTDFGVYLGNEKENVLLPAKWADESLEIGDSLEVFIYRDSADRLIATTQKPLICLGEIAVLSVKEITPIGAFLDWGLEKDLFLPFKEQTARVKVGEKYPVALYVDKSGRLCATMKIYPYLGCLPNAQKGDSVKGTAYEYIDKFGMFVAIDNRYQGMIPKKALFSQVKIGAEITATVSKVREDGKLELEIREASYLAIDSDSELILNKLKQNGGILLFGDKSDPKEIAEEFGISKAAFKRACGHLYKEGKIQTGENKITLI